MNIKVVFPALMILMLTQALTSCGTKEAEYDWPCWRGPNGDGISLDTDWDPEALSGSAKILWKTNIGIGYSNVAIEDGLLYTMGSESRTTSVICLNAQTGKEVWRYAIGPGLESQSIPAVDGARVYGLDNRGALVCLKAKNGKVIWKTHLKDDLNARKTSTG